MSAAPDALDALDTSAVPDFRAMGRLDGRVFVVLGAGQGIGRQSAHALAQAGARVVCVGRRLAPTEHVARETGGLAMAADATSRADMERVAHETLARFGAVHGVVDILGMPRVKPLLEFTDEDWNWQFDASLRHAFLAMQVFAPRIGEHGGGAMVFVSSTSGKVITPDRAPYAASKAALQQLVAAAAIEFGPLQVRVNAVAPGLVLTPRVIGHVSPENLARSAAIYPQGKLGTPAEIAAVILFLAGGLASHVNGQTVYAEGGVSARSPFASLTRP